MRKRIRAVLWGTGAAAAFAAFFVGWNLFENRNFEETFYTLYSDKIEAPVRAVLIADLHQNCYGKDNETLVGRIKTLDPDLILIGGDLVNRDGTDTAFAVSLCGRLAEIAPVYYGFGNHENEAVYGMDLNITSLEKEKDRLGEDPEDLTQLIQNPELVEGLEGAGVTIVQNSSVVTEINGNTVEIGGVSTTLNSFWPYSGNFIYRFASENPEYYKILISHRPEPVMRYIPDYGIDLVVSGHNHGGMVRIPGIGGLYSSDEGLFPELDAGLFETESLTMVVSRGLGEHSAVPRILNRPELVIVDIN